MKRHVCGSGGSSLITHSHNQRRAGKIESEDEFVSMFVHRNEAGAGIDYNPIPKFQ